MNYFSFSLLFFHLLSCLPWSSHTLCFVLKLEKLKQKKGTWYISLAIWSAQIYSPTMLVYRHLFYIRERGALPRFIYTTHFSWDSSARTTWGHINKNSSNSTSFASLFYLLVKDFQVPCQTTHLHFWGPLKGASNVLASSFTLEAPSSPAQFDPLIALL